MDQHSENVKKGTAEYLGELLSAGALQPGNYQITFGQAATPLQLRDETPVELVGVLDTPARWLEARGTELVNGLKAYVMVDREALQITLVTEERNYFKNKITGTLTYHPAFVKFGINQEQYISALKMADKIKMNRAFFENKQVAMNLVTQLRDFKAEVERQIEKRDDKRGNYADVKIQTVNSNLPPSFKMVLPIFKGETPQQIEVEVYIEPENLTCTLVSPEANEEMERLRDEAINDVLDRIKAAIPTIVILEK